MKKKLNEETIKNELQGSVFFRKSDVKGNDPPEVDDNLIPPLPEPTTQQYEPALIEKIRKELKSYGKQAATHRFTAKEKDEIADLIYAFRKIGIQTNENEIARIAINFIINDHKDNGDQSILNLALMMLNE